MDERKAAIISERPFFADQHKTCSGMLLILEGKRFSSAASAVYRSTTTTRLPLQMSIRYEVP